MKILNTYQETHYTQDEIDLMKQKQGQYKASRERGQVISKRMSFAFKRVYGILLVILIVSTIVVVLIIESHAS